MSTPLPAHLVTSIRQRIAWLREACRVDEIYATPRLTDYPVVHRRFEPAGRGANVPGGPGATTPTFPPPHSNDARRRS